MATFTSCHRGDTDYIFWTGPQDFILEEPTGASQPTSTPAIWRIAFMVLCAWRTPVPPCFCRLNDWGASRLRALEARRCTRHLDAGTPVASSG